MDEKSSNTFLKILNFNKLLNFFRNKFWKLVSTNKVMSEIILRNNIRWDRALIKQVRQYKRDGTIPKLADRNFKEIALAISLETSGKITFSNKGTVYEIIPYEEIGGRLDSIMANLALAVRGRDCLYKQIQALNLLGISQPSVMEYLNKDMVHTNASGG